MTNEELIHDMKDHITRGEYEGYALTNEECKQVIQALEQQPKTGHWIAMSEGFTPYECSECESVEFKKSNFCPNCGTDMRKQKLEYADAPTIIEEEVDKESEVEKDVKCIDLCKSCNTKGCIFQSEIVRSHCDFYKAESEE